MASARGVGRTELSADDLKAHLTDAKDGRQPPQLDTVAGRGHTLLHQVRADGTDETSSGDSLDAKFRPEISGNTSSSTSLSKANARLNTAKTRPAEVAAAVPSRTGSATAMGGEGVDDLLSAVQQGHVTMVRRAPAASGAKAGGGASGRTGIAREDFLQATAERAAYDGDLDRVTLTGGVEVSDAGERTVGEPGCAGPRDGDAQAVGAVKVNYLAQASGNDCGLRGTARGDASGNSARQRPVEPTHVVAERADWCMRLGVTTFYGRASEDVAGRIAGAGPGDSSMARQSQGLTKLMRGSEGFGGRGARSNAECIRCW